MKRFCRTFAVLLISVFTQTEAVVPDVYVTNYALAHMCRDNIEKFENQVQRLLVSYWASRKAPHPRLKIFQNARDNHGRRVDYFIGERFRQSNAVLRRALVGKFGFQELDEWLLTAPMLGRLALRRDCAQNGDPNFG